MNSLHEIVMPIPITIPRLGWNMEEGVFVRWLKENGSVVRCGEALFTLESDKSTEDIECHEEGILRIGADGPHEGQTVAVGRVIGYLVAPGEAIPSGKQQTEAPAELHGATGSAGASPSQHVRLEPRPPNTTARRAVSPRARRVARELGIEVNTLNGSGKNGRIRERDVRAAVTASADRGGEAIPISPVRRIIADRMLSSHLSTAPVTLTTTVDVTNLVNLRNQFKAAAVVNKERIPSYTDFLVKLSASTLQKHPLLNAQWIDGQIHRLFGIHIGIAVDTETGLLVPVLRDVPSLGLRQLAIQSSELIERAHTRRLTAKEMEGGTFTVTNLGGFCIDAFTPILHAPQSAILGIGRVQRRPAVLGELIVPREQITLSLTFDHRVVDGAPAAQFLQTLSQMIENPGPWLMG
jgi:pyruvate dehydrogenase E2 component (dihydrolipoamide acetyltransferase)